mmetsp:Transcript_25188/g.69459  ORF Transcript_25188/g.69459 Transcript_25188/m.69459 type:complete len:242 (-) Transcript_25188:138-863(-)
MVLEAFLLALASSTDNFMVGLSVGIANKSLSFGVNALISICNATGAWVAGFGGSTLGQNLPPYVSPLLSTITFGGLALREFVDFLETVRKKLKSMRKEKVDHQSSDYNKRDTTKHLETDTSSFIDTPRSSSSNLDISRAIQLAFPMTLNNLAGGVAGGAIGVSPLEAGLYGLVASFLTMALGHRIGIRLAGLTNKNPIPTRGKSGLNSFFSLLNLLMDPSFASGSLLGVLCLVSLHELVVA